MARIVLKIDVDTLRGTREGVPRLMRMLEGRGAGASFLFSLGPDHTGWALRRVFRPGFLQKVSRTSVVEHYGIKTLLYGVLLPAPDIGRRAADTLRQVKAAGFETGIHVWDHVYWQDNVRQRGRDWTLRQMRLARARFEEVFGCPPSTHGAAGWQTNAYALAELDAWGMRYASDGRGHGPYVPVVEGRALRHVQMPTTLPTVDELLGLDGIDARGVARAILEKTAHAERDQVFTLHAELEGQKLAGVFAELLDGWRSQGHALISMADYYASLDPATLPRCPLAWGEVSGRSGELVVQ